MDSDLSVIKVLKFYEDLRILFFFVTEKMYWRRGFRLLTRTCGWSKAGSCCAIPTTAAPPLKLIFSISLLEVYH